MPKTTLFCGCFTGNFPKQLFLRTPVDNCFGKFLEHWHTWDQVLKSGLSDICGWQPLKNLKGYGLLKLAISLQIF